MTDNGKDSMRNCIVAYTNLKLETVGCKDVPVKDMHTDDDWEVMKKAFEQKDLLSLVQIMAIGFANGVKHERENHKSAL